MKADKKIPEEKIFINLTSGIDAIEREGLDPSQLSFIRIQSSHCEEHQWEQILTGLDSNFLLHAALGRRCIVYDSGSDGDLSKAVYFGLEWIKYVLNRRWLGRDYIPDVKGKNTEEYFEQEYYKLSKKCKRRIDYFRKLLLTGEIHIEGRCVKSVHDNQYEYFREMLRTLYKK